MKRLLFIPLIFFMLSCEDKQESIDNHVPVANDISIVTDENLPIDITLTGFDAEGSELIYEVTAGPLQGILGGELPSITYTPNTNFSGEDSFTYHVFDGINYSEVATVTITVLPNLDGLYINEFLASNSTINVDEVGEYDDWLELYNAGNNSIDLGGFFLTDNVDNLTKWLIPEETVISGSGFLSVWCDEDQEQGVLHTNFKLSADGEFIALVASDGFTIIDSISFDIQTVDISFGRVSDGSTSWVSFTTPTPNSSNGN
jgi:hypothetical protein